MTVQKRIRLFMLLFPLLMAGIIIASDLLIGCVQLTGWMWLIGLFLIPNVIYFLVTIKTKSLLVLLLPAILLCASEILVDYTYITSTSSTTAIMFIVTPFYEIIVMVAGFIAALLVNFIIKFFRH